MNDNSVLRSPLDDEQFIALSLRHLDGVAASEEEAALLDLLRDSPDYRRRFVALCRRIGMLHETLISESGEEAWNNDECGIVNYEDESESLESGIHPSSFVPHPSDPFPIILNAPLSPSFIGGPVFSYMVATLILGVMLLSAWAYKISRDNNPTVVDNSRGQTAPGVVDKTSELVFVGRVTGMKDCRWADPRTETYLGASVSLNRKYALSSGLLEIAYKTGAKVILEGPCSYEVDARDGGYLGLGKLTAQVEIAKPQASKPQDPRPKTQDQNPQSIPHPSSLFTVRTPTAVVTDLGTEFGVEVGENGYTTSHVFRGSVRVEAGGEESVVLRENESVRVEKESRVRETHHATGEKIASVRFTHPTTPPKFVRRIHEPPKLLDLLDIVAGGDGTGRGRGRGIDQLNGGRRSAFSAEWRRGYRTYAPAAWHDLIDGVFVPDSRDLSVQLDSAGHTFSEFPSSLGATFSLIWARAADVAPAERGSGWIFEIARSGRFTPDNRGILAFHACSGITFNLEAMRKRFPTVRPAKFQAVVGLGDPRPFSASADGTADFWIFVDGRLKMKHTGLRQRDDAINVETGLGPKDRFLTLVSTDAGDGIRDDCVVIGDPVLHMAENDPPN